MSDTSTAPTEPARLRPISTRTAPAASHWQEIDELREQHRYFWNEEAQGYWVLTRYEDIREAFQTPEVFCNHSIVADQPGPGVPVPAVVHRSADPHGVPPADEPVVLAGLGRQAGAPPARAGPGRGRGRRRRRAAATTCRRSPTASRSPAFLASMGLPMDDADFFVSVAHRMSGAVGGEPEAVAQMNGGVGRAGRLLDGHARRPPGQPARPDGRLPDDDEPRRRSATSRCPTIDIVDIMVTLTLGSLDTLKSQLGWQHVAPGHPPRRPRPHRRRPGADPERGRGVPAGLPDRRRWRGR